ncbi:MAG: iron-sulfur cluster assembly accessory protein, partial [Alphaproteobacteria bacterium]|nr:iron-sulfur cluster assembly accessory protein [Alphaproteobacteria bacterium]
MSAGISISDRAAERVAHLIEQQSGSDLMLRVLVSGGGCSGFQYSFAFDDTRNDDDLVFSHAGIDVVIDEMSLELLEGAEID